MAVRVKDHQDIQTQLDKLYRLADRRDQVNWDMKYRSDKDLLVRLLPSMQNFILGSIGKVIESERDRKAVIGISGGLDSAVSSWLCSEAMDRSRQEGGSNASSLALLAFKGVNEEDLNYARRFAKELIRNFPRLDVSYQEQDLTPWLRSIEEGTDNLIVSTGITKTQKGSLPTRLISSMVLEFADKTGYCTIDSTNGTEVVLGEFVIGCGGEVAPLASFYKSQVYDLAELLGVPSFVIERRPINSTFGNDKVSSYFGETPNDLTARDVYNVLDPVLYLIYRHDYTPRKLVRELGHSYEFANRAYEIVKKQDHRRAVPYFKLLDHRFALRRTATEIDNGELKARIEDSFCLNDVTRLKRN